MGSEAAALIGMGLCAAGFLVLHWVSHIYLRKPLKPLAVSLIVKQKLLSIAGSVLR